MDPASIIGVVAAAAQFADITRKLAKFIKEVHAGTEAGPTKRRLIQLETWAEVAEKIRDSGEQNDPQTEKIMKHCIPTVEALATHLGRIQISDGDGRRDKTRKAFLARWEKDDIAALFAQLHRDQMTLLTYRSFASEGHLLQKIRESMGSLLDERLQYSERNNQSTLEAKFLRTIYITDPRDDRSVLVHRKTARAEGTCTWITKTGEFLDWMSTAASSPGLMIEGGPGKGKSMIAIYLTEFLENLAQTSEAGTESVIYFFCDNRNPKQNNALAVIRCLVWQLCRLRPGLLHHGIKEAEARGDVRHLLDSPITAVETLWRIFMSMLNDDGSETVSCVIDGLDECDDASILSVLTKFHEFSTGHQTIRSKFKFVILSRPLSSQCQPLALDIPKVCLDPDLNKGDITIFIEQRIHELARANPKRPWRDSLIKKVKSTLLKKAGGTFLWVGFVTDDLRKKEAFEVMPCLRVLPEGLNGIYDRILLRIPRIHRRKIRSILHWTCLAEHPLRKIKLVGLIYDESVDDDGASDTTSSMTYVSDSISIIDTESDMDELEGLLEYCKAIIKIAEDSSVHFVHQSAKDYLMRADGTGNPDLDYFMVGNLQHAHERMALRCIEVIETHAELLEKATDKTRGLWMETPYPGSIDGPHDIGERLRTERGSTSFEYAAAFWVHHVRCSGREYHAVATAKRILRLIDHGGMKEVWLPIYVEIHHSHWYKLRFSAAETSGLRFAMMLGLGTTTRQLVESLSIDDYVSTSRNGDEPLLHSVLTFDQPHIIEVVLGRYGKEIISKDPGILTKAVDLRNRRAVKILLAIRPGARVVHGEDLEMALGMALERATRDYRHQSTDIIELINAGADPFMIPGCRNPLVKVLQWTSYNDVCDEADGQVEVFRQLLERGAGAELETSDSEETLLHLAAAKHNHPVASLLLERGAPINAVDLNGATPLHHATDKTGEDGRICELLITAGQASAMQDMSDEGPGIATWNIDSRNLQGQSALLLASKSAWPEAIELLLGAGANPNLRDNDGQGPIAFVIHHLLDEEIYRGTGQSVWAPSADWDCHRDCCIRCLKRLGAVVADCNGQDVWGRTDLHVLAQLMGQIERPWEKRRYRSGLNVLKTLRSWGINESLKDADGNAAREYYPRDVFWRTEEDPLVIDDADQTSDESADEWW